jgi:hypothetical protein
VWINFLSVGIVVLDLGTGKDWALSGNPMHAAAL